MEIISYELEKNNQKVKVKIETEVDLELSEKNIENIGNVVSELILSILNEPDKEFKILTLV